MNHRTQEECQIIQAIEAVVSNEEPEAPIPVLHFAPQPTMTIFKDPENLEKTNRCRAPVC
ncbi:uncharacterized protein N7473_004427 [Penicillium subrubescens]|uniref:Uncharacterized protein n=1 Tax=Penicillium subrubescens TaxID=1316194 RepID=A0A1Q5UIY6_9EURO|nr:uncharacterized protein N7473_004427 [Penicillium subrubescens]KAJ5900357.1 hypothetical protein N7473_004427 [Penicillium subrubescens]OKP12446.1 hypothetical protein PENSUB_1915 [Penicillium subrubescens]